MNLIQHTYRIFYVFALGFCCSISLYAQEPKKTGPIIIPGETTVLPPLREEFPKLRDRIASLGTPDTSDSAIEILRQYHGVEEFVASDIEDCLQVGRVDYRFWQDFAVLARLRTPNALRVVASYLDDKRILHSPSEDVAHESTSARAGMALARMNLADAPTKDYGWRGLSAKEIEAWKTWWKAHEGNLEEALNPKPKPSPIPEPKAQGQRVTKDEAPPRSVDKVQSTVDHSSLPGLLLAALGALIVAVAAFLLRRKPEK